MGRDANGTAWPERWQPEARDALSAFLGADDRLRIVVDDPKTAVHGTVMEGFFYVEDGAPMCIYDRSGDAGFFPWPLLSGPVLRIELLRSRRPAVLLYAHPDWRPP